MSVKPVWVIEYDSGSKEREKRRREGEGMEGRGEG